jgi:cystathionine beta-synthase
VVSAGTGGQLTGISRKLKELDPKIQIIGVDPNGSILAQPDELNKEGIHGYKVEGIGYDFIPRVLDRQFTDMWMKTDDQESFDYARRLIREEGMLVGGSSGCAMAAAIKFIKDHNIGEGKRVVVLLPDSVRNYITKFINNDWMYENGFINEEQCTKLSTSTLVPSKDWGQDFTVKDLQLKEAHFLPAEMSVKDAIKAMSTHSFDQFPVRNLAGEVVGCPTSTILTTKLVKNKVTMSDKVEKAVMKEFRSISSSTKLNELGRVLGRHTFALVDNKYVVSSFDLLNFMSEKQQ